MKVKKLKNFQNKKGLMGCKWSSLNGQGTENPQSLNLVTTEQPESCVYEPPERCADEEFPSNFIEGILSTIKLYFRSLIRYLESKINEDN